MVTCDDAAGRAQAHGGRVNPRRTAIVPFVLAAAVLAAGCGSGSDQRTARLEAEVAALKSDATSTTATTAAPATTTTVPATTTTTAERVVAVTTTRPTPTTTTTVAAWCSVRALASPVVHGMTQKLYVTSNLPGRSADVDMQAVPMDASGSGMSSVLVMGGSTPRTAKVTVRFYTQAWTLKDIVDPPFPPVLTSCMTSYLVAG